MASCERVVHNRYGFIYVSIVVVAADLKSLVVKPLKRATNNTSCTCSDIIMSVIWRKYISGWSSYQRGQNTEISRR